MDAHAPTIVLKVGGSLLSLPDFPERLHVVLRQYEGLRPVIMCGGGDAADIVRTWQPVHRLSDEQAHWLAFRAVSLNEGLLAQVLPGAVVAQSVEALQKVWGAGRLPILAAERFVRTEEASAPHVLPHDWSVTGDSIAAWVAQRLGGRRLVLLKSCTLPGGIGLEEAAERGLVDAHFPTAAAGLAVDWANLRDEMRQLIEWSSASDRQSPSVGQPV